MFFFTFLKVESLKNILFLSILLVFSFQAGAEVPFHSESELGSTIVSGNTQTSTLNAADKTSYQTNDNVYKFSARYLQATANGIESAKNWDGSLRYERRLAENFSIYASFGLDSDIYSNYVQRNNYDLGGKYFLSQSKETNWFAELGYRNSYAQFVTPGPNAQSNIIRVYSEFSQQLALNSSAKFWFEYLPNLSDRDDYRFNFEPSVSVMLNEIFSLKAADLFKYQNELPPNFKKYMDSFFTLSLVSKF